jgi:hypothetical protein
MKKLIILLGTAAVISIEINFHLATSVASDENVEGDPTPDIRQQATQGTENEPGGIIL